MPARDPLRKRKDRAERELTRLVSMLLAEQRKRAIAALPEEIDLNEDVERWLEVLEPALMKYAGIAATYVMRLVPKKQGLFEKLLEFIRGYGFGLVMGINETTAGIIRRGIRTYYEVEGTTMGDLVSMIGRAFTPGRASRIAVTEVTRAFSAGNSVAAEEIRAAGFEVEEVWRTNRDSVCCEECAALDGKVRGDGWNDPPPLHPECRCWTTTRIV